MVRIREGRRKNILIIALLFIFLLAILSTCSSHSSGYDNTEKCPVCGKTATHHTSNYGFCDEHWQDAAGQ